MMPNFTSYDPATGQISSVQMCATIEEAGFNARGGHVTVAGAYRFDETYFPNGVPTPKGTITPTVDGNVVSGLPSACDVQIFGKPVEHVTGGSYTLPNVAGRYMVLIRAPEFREARIQVIIE